MLEVVTVWAPRPQHPKWRDGYLDLLKLQNGTVRRVGHRHVIVTDQPEVPGFADLLHAELPESLMHALIAGQVAYLEQWNDAHPVVMLDMDCLVARDLGKAFRGEWDIGLTNRELKGQEIQNGAMYFAPGSRKAALKMLRKTLDLCEDWWGADQAALSQAVAPVPRLHRVEMRLGARIGFLACEDYNFSPKAGVPKARAERFVLHFKGDAKQFAADTASRHFLLPGME